MLQTLPGHYAAAYMGVPLKHTVGCICPHTEFTWKRTRHSGTPCTQNDTYELNKYEDTKHSSRLASAFPIRTHALRLINFRDSSLLQRRQLRCFTLCQVITRCLTTAFHSCTSPVSSPVCCHHTVELLKGPTLSGRLLPLRVGCHCAAISGALVAKELHRQTTSPKQ